MHDNANLAPFYSAFLLCVEKNLRSVAVHSRLAMTSGSGDRLCGNTVVILGETSDHSPFDAGMTAFIFEKYLHAERHSAGIFGHKCPVSRSSAGASAIVCAWVRRPLVLSRSPAQCYALTHEYTSPTASKCA